jgi:hypothetical protein
VWTAAQVAVHASLLNTNNNRQSQQHSTFTPNGNYNNNTLSQTTQIGLNSTEKQHSGQQQDATDLRQKQAASGLCIRPTQGPSAGNFASLPASFH